LYIAVSEKRKQSVEGNPKSYKENKKKSLATGININKKLKQEK